MDRIEELRHRLQELLKEATIPADELLALSHDVASEVAIDQGVIFTVDASHISRLGLELVSRQETAVSELIKNAYDADATSVDVVFKSTSNPGGMLEITDNGSGMSFDQLRDGFMKISTQDKALFPMSPHYARGRAGRKGIGRFATQRLGRGLRVITQQAEEPHALEIDIDWDRFQAGSALHQIANKIRKIEPQAKPGTVLLISSLRDSWSPAQVRRAYRYISELLQPFPLDKKPEGAPSKDPGFKVTFYEQTNEDFVTLVSEEQEILQRAVAKITATVMPGGKATVTVALKSKGGEDKWETIEKELNADARLKGLSQEQIQNFQQLEGVGLSAHYFIDSELPTGTRTMIREILNRRGGIRVYRNGFRVLPYGEAYDDWVGLQSSSALRQVLPPHHRTNFLGFVEIHDLEGGKFEETASREGLVENDAFKQLQSFVYQSLLTGVIEVAVSRKRKVFASDPSTPRSKRTQDQSSPKEAAETIAQELRAVASSMGESDSSRTLTEIAGEVEELGLSSAVLLEEIGMLRVLASLGLSIGEFTHEVGHILIALSAATNALKNDSGESTSLGPIVANLASLRSYIRYFDDVVSHNADRQLKASELREVIGDFVTFISPSLDKQGIKINVQFKGYDLFACPMHRSEWGSILLNLCVNSQKAIQRSGGHGRIEIECREAGDMLELSFSDDGDGIPDEYRGKIFDAFFTTNSPGSPLSSTQSQIVGSGLGLKIVRDIVESVGGDISLGIPSEDMATRFIIEIPKATEAQIGNELR